MNLPRPLKVLLFALTLWQPLYIVGFMVMIATAAPSSASGFQTLMTIHMATCIESVLLLVFYVVHVFRAKSVASDKRALWGIALFCGAPIAMPLYFFAHVWPEQPQSWSMDHVVARRD